MNNNKSLLEEDDYFFFDVLEYYYWIIEPVINNICDYLRNTYFHTPRKIRGWYNFLNQEYSEIVWFLPNNVANNVMHSDFFSSYNLVYCKKSEHDSKISLVRSRINTTELMEVLILLRKCYYNRNFNRIRFSPIEINKYYDTLEPNKAKDNRKIVNPLRIGKVRDFGEIPVNNWVNVVKYYLESSNKYS